MLQNKFKTEIDLSVFINTTSNCRKFLDGDPCWIGLECGTAELDQELKKNYSYKVKLKFPVLCNWKLYE